VAFSEALSTLLASFFFIDAGNFASSLLMLLLLLGNTDIYREQYLPMNDLVGIWYRQAVSREMRGHFGMVLGVFLSLSEVRAVLLSFLYFFFVLLVQRYPNSQIVSSPKKTIKSY
jgi:hypothetical protein